MGVLAAGCSVILSTAEPTQCTTSDDCDANPTFHNRACQGGFCVLPVQGPGSVDKPDADATACVSTAQCTRAHTGEGWHCEGNGGQCVLWEANGCKFGAGDWMDDNAIIIGDIQPFTASQASGRPAEIPYADRVRKAIDMAVEEIALTQPAGIIPPSSPPHPIAVLHCDSRLEPATAQKVFRHLTEVVRAKAVIIGGDDDLAAVAQDARTKGTAIICSDCVGAFPEPPLAWRTIPRAALQAPMAVWRLGVLEAQRKAEPNPPTTLRVAILTEPGRAPAALTEQFTAHARFNGKDTIQNGTTNYHVELTEDPREVGVDHAAHAMAIANFRPDVIMVAMGDDFETFYVKLIEQNWPADKPLPYYIVTELNYDESRFQSIINDNDDLRKRISGTCNASSQLLKSNVDGFKFRFKNRYPGHDPSGNWSGYEAAYSLIYAMQAASIGGVGTLDGPTAGSAISDGFKRLHGGSSVNVGKEQIGFAFSSLGQSTQTIDLRGLWSELDWDLVTRDLDGDIGMYCFQNEGGKITIKADAGPRLVKGATDVINSYACD